MQLNLKVCDQMTLSKKLLEKYDPFSVDDIWIKINKELSKKQNPIFVLHGGYGKKNVGDDAICGMLIERIKKYIQDPYFIVICHGPKEIKKLYSKEIKEAYHFKDVRTFKAAIKADAYVIGGGGIINKINTYSGFSNFKILDMKGKFMFIIGILAKLFGAKLVFFSIGATSIPDIGVKLLSKLAINFADHTSVRDPLSQKILKKIGIKKSIPLAFDPVILLKPSSKLKARKILQNEKIPLNKPLIGITFRYVRDDVFKTKKKIQILADIINNLIKKYDVNMLFVPFGRHPSKVLENDKSFARELEKNIANKDRYFILKKDYRPKEYKAILSILDFAILERLHAIIMAAPTGIPFIALSYDNKVDQFLKMIKMSEVAFPLEKLEKSKFLNFIDTKLQKVKMVK
jgi:polysaccharide pyruvyl transferase CsaB